MLRSLIFCHRESSFIATDKEDASGLAWLARWDGQTLTFEDAVLHEAARHANVDAIVTRDSRGFARAALPIHTPTDLLNVLKSVD